MNAWGEVNNIGNKIKMLSDPYLLFTKAIGAEVDRNTKGMGIRSNRYAMVIDNLKILLGLKNPENKDDHYGHKNVLFLETDEELLPRVPFGAAGYTSAGFRDRE